MLTQGIVQGGFLADVDLFDWVGGEEGLNALANVPKHEEQSTRAAELLTKAYREHPDRPIVLTGHSAGTGVAVWALEKLPPDVKVDTLLMLQSALSPGYDLSKALSHVRRAYAFNSPLDSVVLGTGTSLFGTIDRQKVEAAGKVGFVMPDGANAAQYAKLRQFSYDPAWLRFGNFGDHIGVMMRPFARGVISTVLQTGELPSLPPIAVVVPATPPANH
jgi:pimeloyl-ACP methyl ester carboxylesterase